jgi:uncharacterized C2H2 Zn-finger protein
MAKQKRLKCSKCDRRFSMPAHLARHVNSAHGSGKRKAGRPPKGRKAGRRPGRAIGKGTANLHLAGLTLTELCHVIDMARAEAKRRLEQF